MISRCLPLVGLAAFLAGAGTPARASPESPIIYEGIGTGMLELFDPDADSHVVAGRQYLQSRAGTTDIGGPIGFCSNRSFHCADSALAIVVPKYAIRESWSHAGMACRLARRRTIDGESAHFIQCSARHGGTNFWYSRQRGVISYVNKCPGCDDIRFRLVSPKGLFALP